MSTQSTVAIFSAPLVAPTSAVAAVPVAGKKGTALSGRHAIALACAVCHGQPLDKVLAFMGAAKLHGLCTTVATLGGYTRSGGFTATGWATLGNAVLQGPPEHAAWVAPEVAADLLMQAAGSKHAAVWVKAFDALGVVPATAQAPAKAKAPKAA